ncbi:protease inhibitor I42 family protein [Paenibacillus apiarius]|uniref:protease inhibitor I42 family protein n=1 Tax=Paenibacillus apiarius TaxID=46240 RepID=UPI003B3BB3DE
MKITKSMITVACLAGCLSVGSMSIQGNAFASITPVKSVDGNKATDSIKPAKKENDHLKEINVAAGKTFDITLEENLTTGHSWSYATDQNGIKLVAEKGQEPKQSEPFALGAGNEKTWTFKATKPGTYTLTFTYSRPWEKEQKPAETKVYTIKVTEQDEAEKQQSPVVLVADKVNSVKTGQFFSVNMEENTSTGHSWSYATDQNGIKLVAEKSQKPKQGEPFALGAGNEKTWTFKATKPGTYTLTFTYSRPWEKEQKPAQMLTYTVKVN